MSARRFSLLSLMVLGVIATVGVLSGPAFAARGHVFGSSFGGKGSGAGQFDEPAGVAVSEATGRVYVVDKGNNRVEYFSSTGTYEGEFNGSGTLGEGTAAGHGGIPGELETGQFSEPGAIAVDNSKEPSDPSTGDVYVIDTGHSVIDKYSADGTYIGQLTGTPTYPGFLRGPSGIAVDIKGNVWTDYRAPTAGVFIASFTDTLINEYLTEHLVVGGQADLASVEPREQGLAIDANNDLYIRGVWLPNQQFTHDVAEINGSEKILNEDLGSEEGNPEVGSWPAVEISNGDAYVGNVGFVGRFGPEGSLIERVGEGHLVDAAGVAVDSLSETLYIADSSADVVDTDLSESPGHPTVESESVSDVTGGSAVFEATVNPRGEGTEYRFEYGICGSPATCVSSAYEVSVPVPDGFVGSDFNIYSVGVHPQNLRAGTTYHFRVVAHNVSGSLNGEAQVFTTQTNSGELALPDGREWELVSPVDKDGALFAGVASQPQASVSGGGFVDVARSPSEPDPQGNAGNVSVLFTRGLNGWSSKVLAAPHEERTGIESTGQEFRLFSEDLSLGVLQPAGNFLALSPGATESTPYLRTNYSTGNPGSRCESSCFTPLVTSANTPPGTAFGEEDHGECPSVDCGPQIQGASPDLSHIVFISRTQLTSTPIRSAGLYVWAGGQLQLVSVLPTGEEAEGGGVAALEPQLGEEEASVGNLYIARNTVSEDGSRIIWTGHASEGGPRHLYLHDTTKGETIRIDAPQGGHEENGGLNYMTASSDGSRVFFLGGAGLTAEGSESGKDLYEYDLNALVGTRLTDLSVDERPGEAADVTGVVGASEDGSYVYFLAAGVLATGAEPGECGESGKKLCNLYVRHDGKTIFIAGLSQEDDPDWARPNRMPARVSPDGEWLEFMSNRSLTGYDPDDAVSGHPDEEVYLYHAASGRVVCASCNPTGARPTGVRAGEETGVDQHVLYLTGAEGLWGANTWVASNVPPWAPAPFEEASAFYQSRYLSDSGRLFFDSHDALVPQDVNGTEDVYEYEPGGTGDCAVSSVSFSERSGGCVGLISSGSSPEESAFLDASTTGDDVFFLTAAKLVSEDVDSELDVYDAHECSTQVPCFAPASVAPPPCDTGDACKAAPTPQPAIFGEPASATFTGTGNITPSSKAAVAPKSATRAQKLTRALSACRKKNHKKRVVCERKARSMYGVKGSAGSRSKRSKG